MLLGDKIKFLRNQLGITQNKLAELTGIHPVSIRKYETNKMQPQPMQLEKLAEALGVSYNALSDSHNGGMRLETVGDLIGIVITLCNAEIIQFRGKRDEKNRLLNDTVSIVFNPLFSDFFNLLNSDSAGDFKLLTDVEVIINRKDILDDLLNWEKINYMYMGSLAYTANNPTTENKLKLAEINELKELIELQLQKSQILLHSLI